MKNYTVRDVRWGLGNAKRALGRNPLLMASVDAELHTVIGVMLISEMYFMNKCRKGVGDVRTLLITPPLSHEEFLYTRSHLVQMIMDRINNTDTPGYTPVIVRILPGIKPTDISTTTTTTTTTHSTVNA